MAIGIENIYTSSERNVKYLFKKATNYDSDKLVIVFSALGKTPVYNYVRTLEGIDINQLFILDDYGKRGSYYLGQMPEYIVEKSVVSLIEYILKTNKIDRKNVMCAGSSKGGWAAIFFAIKLKLRYVVVAEPQIKIAKYLIDYNAFDVLETITGKSEMCEEEIIELNSLLYKLVEKNDNIPQIVIHAGKETYFFKYHVDEFVKKLQNQGKEVTLCLENYSKHKELINYYPDLLIDKILNYFPEISEQIYIRKVLLEKEKYIIK